jgi:hypothetical protein
MQHRNLVISHQDNAIAEVEKAGFDLSLVNESLALSHTERAKQHDQALDLVLELERIREEPNAQFTTPAPRAIAAMRAQGQS